MSDRSIIGMRGVAPVDSDKSRAMVNEYICLVTTAKVESRKGYRVKLIQVRLRSRVRYAILQQISKYIINIKIHKN